MLVKVTLANDSISSEICLSLPYPWENRKHITILFWPLVVSREENNHNIMAMACLKHRKT